MGKSNIKDNFKLLKWFGWASLIVITCIAVAQAMLMSSFLTSHIFKREGELTEDFVQNFLVADGSLDYLASPDDVKLKEKFTTSVGYIKNMDDMLRANIYKTDESVAWSTEPNMTGKKFPGDNDELEDALKGKVVINPAHISEFLLEKKEHVGINPAIEYFVESYIPVIQPKTGKVIGVVEFYRAPVELTLAINEGRKQVWMTAIISTLILFSTLFWIVRRADTLIKKQQSRLVETETLAVLGELASSVAHNIRNPLSSIRAAAELALESPKDDCTEEAKDIIREADRISTQITELLNYSTDDFKDSIPVDLNTLLEQSIAQNQQSFERKKIELKYISTAKEAVVLGEDAMLQQVFQVVLSNAAEAMEGGGHCEVKLTDEDNDFLSIEFSDTGSGISPELKNKILRPFFTTKPKGLGLGLSMANKIIERFDGSLEFHDNANKGTIVKIILPKR
jgi:signal transduction histidine kinase